MRLPDESFSRFAGRAGLLIAFAAALGGCAMLGGGFADGAARTSASSAGQAALAAGTGPAADYPVVVGEPYRIGTTLHTPADTLNYDEVGYLAADPGHGVSGAHHTLPLPSYVEVTSLDSGRTILVRLERRGPMDGDALVALSPAALAQLGSGSGTPVRVRRVNPPEEERAVLRAGQSAPLRMDTPESLLAVLKRKLPASGAPVLARSAPPAPITSVELAPSAASASPGTAPQAETRPLPTPPLPTLQATAAPAPVAARAQPVVVASLPEQPAPRAAAPAPAPQQPVQRAVPPPAQGIYVVQVAALSSRDRARQVASAIGGEVSQVGSLYRIRTGPFTTRGQAEASLAKVRAAGYSEARIFTNG